MLLIIDSPALCYRAKFAMQKVELSFEEMKTEIIFNFLNQILSLAKRFETNHFAFCWDSRKSFRRDLYPDYKYKRKEDKTQEEIKFDSLAYTQFHRLRREVLPALGFKNNFIQTGLEADDIIASIVISGVPQKHVIISRDNDLYQLLNNCDIFDFQTLKVMDRKKFMIKYLIEPIDWKHIKKIAGCKGDNVSGINGVKEKTAIKFWRGELPEHYKAFKAIISEEGQKIIERNKALVCLPFDGTKIFDLYNNKLYSKDFYDVFESLGFKSFLTQESFWEWEERFGLL